MTNKMILHPYVFAAYAVSFLFSKNIAHIPFIDSLFPLFATQIGAVVLYSFFLYLIKDKEKAGLEATLVLLLSLSYGHMFLYLVQKNILNYNDHRLLAAIYSAVFIFGVWSIWRVFKKTSGITVFLNLATLALLSQSIFQIILFQIRKPVENTQALSFSVDHSLDPDSLPDIYYIVLDGYGSNDTLSMIYDYDNSDFIGFLQNRGFYIAQNSDANYTQTLPSLASTLTLNYLDQNFFSSQNQAQYNNHLETMLLNNNVRQTLEDQGYKTISIDSGWSPTKWENAAEFYSFDNGLDSFEYLYLLTTPAIIFQNDFLYDIHRQQILFSFESLKKTVTLESPSFVFAHIVAPHPPFVFDSNGESVQPDRTYNLRDSDFYEGSVDDYITGYRGEVEFINRNLVETISIILDNADSTPIIIIQGDHGPGAYFDSTWSENNVCLSERTGILNAYLFPEEAIQKLYSGITPVNSFRIILNTLFLTEFEMLRDINYYVDFSNLAYIDISNIKTCSIP